jgi:hypothetical protein
LFIFLFVGNAGFYMSQTLKEPAEPKKPAKPALKRLRRIAEVELAPVLSDGEEDASQFNERAESQASQASRASQSSQPSQSSQASVLDLSELSGSSVLTQEKKGKDKRKQRKERSNHNPFVEDAAEMSGEDSGNEETELAELMRDERENHGDFVAAEDSELSEDEGEEGDEGEGDGEVEGHAVTHAVWKNQEEDDMMEQARLHVERLKARQRVDEARAREREAMRASVEASGAPSGAPSLAPSGAPSGAPSKNFLSALFHKPVDEDEKHWEPPSSGAAEVEVSEALEPMDISDDERDQAEVLTQPAHQRTGASRAKEVEKRAKHRDCEPQITAAIQRFVVAYQTQMMGTGVPPVFASIQCASGPSWREFKCGCDDDEEKGEGEEEGGCGCTVVRVHTANPVLARLMAQRWAATRAAVVVDGLNEQPEATLSPVGAFALFGAHPRPDPPQATVQAFSTHEVVAVVLDCAEQEATFTTKFKEFVEFLDERVVVGKQAQVRLLVGRSAAGLDGVSSKRVEWHPEATQMDVFHIRTVLDYAGEVLADGFTGELPPALDALFLDFHGVALADLAPVVSQKALSDLMGSERAGGVVLYRATLQGTQAALIPIVCDTREEVETWNDHMCAKIAGNAHEFNARLSEEADEYLSQIAERLSVKLPQLARVMLTMRAWRGQAAGDLGTVESFLEDGVSVHFDRTQASVVVPYVQTALRNGTVRCTHLPLKLAFAVEVQDAVKFLAVDDCVMSLPSRRLSKLSLQLLKASRKLAGCRWFNHQ